MARLIREPLVHFLIIGALIFAAYAVLNPASERGVSENTIAVDQNLVTRLAGQFESVWRRPPTVEELDTLISAYVREEVLVREALNLSMDVDDVVIRQRLAQKMTFLLEGAASAEAPDEKTLRAFYDENADRYIQPGRIAFDQVFLGETPTEDEIAAARIALASGKEPPTPTTLLPARIPLSPQPAIDGLLGAGFFDAIAELPGATWAGPIESGYGLHLVRLTDRLAPQKPPFEAYRDRIEADWRAARVAERTEEVYRSLEQSYEISRPSAVDLESAAQ